MKLGKCEGPNWLGQIKVKFSKIGLGGIPLYIFLIIIIKKKRKKDVPLEIDHFIAPITTYKKKINKLN